MIKTIVFIFLLSPFYLLASEIGRLELNKEDIVQILPTDTKFTLNAFQIIKNDQTKLVNVSVNFQRLKGTVPPTMSYGYQKFSFQIGKTSQDISFEVFHVPGDSPTVSRMINSHFFHRTGFWSNSSAIDLTKNPFLYHYFFESEDEGWKQKTVRYNHEENKWPEIPPKLNSEEGVR